MAISADVVRRLTVVATDTGLTTLKTKLDAVGNAQDRVAASSARMSAATENARRRIEAITTQASGPLTAIAGRVGGDVLNVAGRIAAVGTAALAVYGTFKLLEETFTRGTALLEKYGTTGQRALYGFVNEDALTKLTRFQGDNLTSAQSTYAAQLAGRMEEADRKLKEAWKTTLDLVDASLKLQNVWVLIKETAADFSGWLFKATKYMETIGNSSFWNKLNTGGSNFLPGAIAPQDAVRRINEANGTGVTPQISAEEAMRIARARLAAGLGGGFQGRFGAVTDTPKDEKKDTDDKRDSWDRYADSVVKATAALSANAQTVGLGAQAHERLRVQLQGEAILERDGVKDTEERRKKLEELAKAAGEAAVALEKVKVANQIDYDRKTLFLSPDDVRIAQQLKGIYGNDIPAALASAEAATMRANLTLGRARDYTADFANSFAQSMFQGKSATEAFRTALQSLESQLLSLVTRGLVNQLFAGLTGGNAGGLSSLFRFETGGIMTSAGPLPLRTYAGGGVANSPQVAVYGEGKRPEAYVPLPDGRSIPVTMKGDGASTYAPTMNITVQGDGVTEDQVKRVVSIAMTAQYRQIKKDFPKWGAQQRAAVG